MPLVNANEAGDLITITDLIAWALPPETVPPLGWALVSTASRITSTRQKCLEPLCRITLWDLACQLRLMQRSV